MAKRLNFLLYKRSVILRIIAYRASEVYQMYVILTSNPIPLSLLARAFPSLLGAFRLGKFLES